MKYQAAVLTVSDKCSRGEREDTSGPALCEMLTQAGFDVAWTGVVPDERDQIAAALIRCADELRIPLVITTGGTGFSQRDITPEATLDVVERPTPGIPEAMRWASLQVTPRGCLSRGAAGIRGKTHRQRARQQKGRDGKSGRGARRARPRDGHAGERGLDRSRALRAHCRLNRGKGDLPFPLFSLSKKSVLDFFDCASPPRILPPGKMRLPEKD